MPYVKDKQLASNEVLFCLRKPLACLNVALEKLVTLCVCAALLTRGTTGCNKYYVPSEITVFLAARVAPGQISTSRVCFTHTQAHVQTYENALR